MTDLNRSPIEKSIRRETDKALLVTVVTGQGDYRDVWFPKSQVEVKGHIIWVAAWLLDKKAHEVGGIITTNRDVAAQMSVAA